MHVRQAAALRATGTACTLIEMRGYVRRCQTWPRWRRACKRAASSTAGKRWTRAACAFTRCATWRFVWAHDSYSILGPGTASLASTSTLRCGSVHTLRSARRNLPLNGTCTHTGFMPAHRCVSGRTTTVRNRSSVDSHQHRTLCGICCHLRDNA